MPTWGAIGGVATKESSCQLVGLHVFLAHRRRIPEDKGPANRRRSECIENLGTESGAMTTLGLLSGIRDFIAFVVEMTWLGFGYALDGLVSLSAIQAGLILFALLSLHVAMALRMQKHLNTTLDENPAEELFPLELEARFTIVGALLSFVVKIVLLPVTILLYIIKLFRKKEAEEEKKKEKKPLLVPTLGPSYLWAALIVVGLYVLALVVEPVIRWQLGVPFHFPTWQFLFFGHRPELGPFLPLQTYPYVAAVVITAFWFAIWWNVARIVRLFHWEAMGVNLIKEEKNQEILPSWRTHFGVTDLANLDWSFQNWSKWLPYVALPLLGLAYISLAGDPYRVSPSMFAVGLIGLTSWWLHQRMAGVYRPEEEENEVEERREEATAAGWTDVLNDLRRIHRIPLPALREPLRDVEPLAMSRHRLEGSQLISPLLAELLPGEQRLTVMQHSVLSSISRHSFVHLDVPGDTRTLELGARAQQPEEELRHRNQIIIAPEGSGKTVLGMLAALNTALIHTRSTLVLVRDKATSERLARTFQSIVEPSTLRWNLRVRQIGGDLVEDLAQGIIPDVLICDLQELVTALLDDVETYRPFLTNLGLIVIDDIETFCGPVEVHAQLAMRRLDLRLRTLKGIHEEGDDQAPIFLLLAGDTMDDLPAWARSLCGIDAVPRTFASQGDARRSELARQARKDVDSGGRKVSQELELLEKTQDGRIRRQLIYDLKSFATPTGALSVIDIVEACESLAVPWHFRACGDDRRLLGRSVLPLKNEPQSYVDDPLKAAVLFLDGHATAVDRELKRLGRAGAHFTSRSAPLEEPEELIEESSKKEPGKDKAPQETSESKESSPKKDGADEGLDPDTIEPIALVTIVDSDERLLQETMDETEGIEELLESLPRPFLRPPSGYLTKRHLTSELIQHWTEVADLLKVFGNEIALDLRRLTRQGAILQDPRTTLEPGKKSYENRVYLRGLEAVILGNENGNTEDLDRLLPPPVEDVEVASRQNVSIRERSTLVTLGRVDAESARHRFYKGRIFDTLRGRHVVVGYAGDEASKEGAFEVGDIVAEPFLGEEISTPRRRVVVDLVASPKALTPEPLFLGDSPFGVGLFPVICRFRHLGAFRLDPQTGTVRQRIYGSEEERNEESTLHTRALGLFPYLEEFYKNISDEEDDRPRPRLTLLSARLIGAALRAVTPLIYRGADNALGIALHLTEEEPPLDYLLGAGEGFFFYDLHGNGNGAARAIQRDGIEPILVLTLHLLRQLEDPQRLLARHDEWDGLLSEAARKVARAQAIEWLKSRLTFQEDEETEENEANQDFEVTR